MGSDSAQADPETRERPSKGHAARARRFSRFDRATAEEGFSQKSGTVGNVSPSSVTSISSSLGTTSVTNLAAMVGGMDPESDDELRTRFKATFLRNIAGTRDFYHGIALQNQNVSRVAVFGPTSLYRTQIVAPTDVYTLPIGADAKYTWPDATVFRDLAQVTETFFTAGVDYNFQSGTSAAFFRVDGGGIEAGDILDLEFEYTSSASRNDPLSGITNKVDVYVDGVDPNFITERTRVSSQQFSSSPSQELYTGNFVRNLTGGAPSRTNRFMRLGSTPVVSFPSTIIVGTTTYVEGVHYHFVRGTTSLQGSTREVAGVEWFPSGPSDNTPILVSYSYNRTPELINAVLKGAKQITTDVLVHQCHYRYLRVCLSVEYEPGFSIQMTNNSINQVLRDYVSTFPYGSWIEFSDITYIIHGIRGVDNVWVSTDVDDAVNFGVQDYVDATSASPVNRYTSDFKLSDGELPALKDVIITRKVNR